VIEMIGNAGGHGGLETLGGQAPTASMAI